MIIGLTGGIGSGKTTVAKLFEVMDCIIYNSDERAKEIYFDPTVKSKVIDLLGKAAYISESEIDKAYIANKVFSDNALLQQLNAIIHPAVKDDFIRFVKKFPSSKIIVKETALLFEANLHQQTDYSILVTAPTDLKIKRVTKRNSISKEEVEKRIQAQWPDEQKAGLANFVITNDDQTALIPQVVQIIETFRASIKINPQQ